MHDQTNLSIGWQKVSKVILLACCFVFGENVIPYVRFSCPWLRYWQSRGDSWGSYFKYNSTKLLILAISILPLFTTFSILPLYKQVPEGDVQMVIVSLPSNGLPKLAWNGRWRGIRYRPRPCTLTTWGGGATQCGVWHAWCGLRPRVTWGLLMWSMIGREFEMWANTIGGHAYWSPTQGLT